MAWRNGEKIQEKRRPDKRTHDPGGDVTGQHAADNGRDNQRQPAKERRQQDTAAVKSAKTAIDEIGDDKPHKTDRPGKCDSYGRRKRNQSKGHKLHPASVYAQALGFITPKFENIQKFRLMEKAGKHHGQRHGATGKRHRPHIANVAEHPLRDTRHRGWFGI